MLNRIIYTIGCFIGGSLLIFSPILENILSMELEIWNVDLAMIGSLIVGVVMLLSYYSCKTPHEKYQNWWKSITGVFFVLLFLASFFPFKVSVIVKSFLYAFYLIALYSRYNQLKTNFTTAKKSKSFL